MKRITRRPLLLIVILTISGSAIAGALVVRGAGRDRPPEEPVAQLPSGERLSDSRERAAAPNPAATGIDLLDHVELRRDVVCGAWGYQGPALFTASLPFGRLQIRCIPPEEYDLKLVALRKHGVDSLDIGFVHGGRQGVLRIDGQEGQFTWIELDTSPTLSSNPTASAGKRLRWNRPTSILLSVRRSGVSVVVDGVRLVDWKGDPSQLRLSPEFRVPQRDTLFIGSSETMFRIDELTLLPVSGTPRFLP
jgi:hypothetical protein